MSGGSAFLQIVGAILGSVGLASLIYAFLILAQLGRKLGAVTKMPPYYRVYYVAVSFLGLALLMRLVRASVFSSPPQDTFALYAPLFYLWLYHLPLALGVTIGLATTWYYWHWLLKD